MQGVQGVPARVFPAQSEVGVSRYLSERDVLPVGASKSFRQIRKGDEVANSSVWIVSIRLRTMEESHADYGRFRMKGGVRGQLRVRVQERGFHTQENIADPPHSPPPPLPRAASDMDPTPWLLLPTPPTIAGEDSAPSSCFELVGV
eukprot:3941310-Rhodomonas_salina.1